VTYLNDNSCRGDETPTASSLLRGAANDDKTAWDRLVSLYGPIVYSWCRRAGLQPSDAADTVQEVLRGVARNISDFHHDEFGDTFRGWLRRITQRRIADYRRRRSRDVAPPVGGSTVNARLHQQVDPVSMDLSTTSPNGVISEENCRQLQRVQSEFSRRNWQIFWRVVVEERETADVADEFGVSPNVVRLAKSRILKRLRETMNETDLGDERS
jgi:RNA polymerase sigma-70 factor (ECF subfamily)